MNKKRLGEMLLEAGVIDETQLQAALGHQRKWGGKLGQALLDLKLATEPQIVSALSKKFGYEVVNVATLPRTPQVDAAMRLVPRELALRQMLLPIASDTNSLTVAMADPSNIAVIDELSFRTGRRIKIALAGDREIAGAVRRLYFADEEAGPVKAIPLDDPSNSGLPIEMTKDPFAAMPDYIREGYFKRPAHTLSDQAPSVRAVMAHQAQAAAQAVIAPGPVASPVQPEYAPPPAAYAPPPAGYAMPVTAPPQMPVAYAPRAVPPIQQAEKTDGLGEPILATDLAPMELVDASPRLPPPIPSMAVPAPVQAVPPPAPAAQPRQTALFDLLDRIARGEDSGVRSPGQLAAALARVLLKRGLVREAELLEELARKS